MVQNEDHKCIFDDFFKFLRKGAKEKKNEFEENL